VKKRQFIALLGSIVLILALVLSACAQTAAPTTPTAPTTPAAPTTPTTPTTPAAPQVVTQQVDKVYKVLNPQGTYIPVDCKPCAPRLDSLAGKKIRFYESEATNIQLPTLRERLQKDYPTTTFVVDHTESFGRSAPSTEDLALQASIRGVGW
jgi:ABC-type oligopeptide transport system substrate-binding subunit